MDCKPKPQLVSTVSEENPFSSFLEVGSALQKVVFPIVMKNSEQWISIGTGFFVHSEGIAMTASHVLHEMANIIKDFSNSGDWELYAMIVTNEFKKSSGEAEIFLMPITHCWMPDGLDIGLFWATPLEHHQTGKKLEVGSLPLNLSLPEVGDRIIAFGYHKMDGLVGLNNDIFFSYDTASSFGDVNNVYPYLRDRSILNFPCFESTARFDPGMSGGPVFILRGQSSAQTESFEGLVGGIVCSGMDGVDEGKYISHASLLWPLLGVNVNERDGRPCETHPHFIDLFERGVLQCVGKEFVRVDFRTDGSLNLQYVGSVN